MTKKTRNWLIAFGILALPFLIFLGFLTSDVLAPPPLPPLPNPNGYDDFVRAGKMVAEDTGNYDEMNEAQLRAVVAKNAAALSLARNGFSNECRVPLQFSTNYLNAHLAQLAGIKRLAQAFVAEGQLAEMEDRTNDAIHSCLDTVHLADESARGGVLIDELVGIAIEAIGTSYLEKLTNHLDATTYHETAAALETLDSQRQAWSQFMQQEDKWREAFARLQKRKISKTEVRSLQNIDQVCELKFKTQAKKTRQLMVDLAARAYELDKGKPPASVSDLVPDYLKAIPQDPFTGGNLSLH